MEHKDTHTVVDIMPFICSLVECWEEKRLSAALVTFWATALERTVCVREAEKQPDGCSRCETAWICSSSPALITLIKF